jgi:hypothetical protein
MSDAAPPPGGPRPSGSFGWLLWWQVDHDKLERQVREYRTLKPWQSMRGISALCLLLSATITTALILLRVAGIDTVAFFDVGLMLGIGLFIYFGHRWAMIAAMLLWTLEKILQLADSGGSGIVLQVVWWVVYMHAFFFAFRVEQARRTRPGTDVEVFS